MSKQLFTIGHSTHPIDQFIKLLSMHSVNVICDVRSKPYSKHNPQFNREVLKASLDHDGIKYVFLGDQLGARSKHPSHYINGTVQYSMIAATPEFHEGLERIRRGMENYRVAIMCTEKDPLTCHRSILVCRHLRGSDIDIQHILEDGSLESNDDLERRLKSLLKIPEQDLFIPQKNLIEHAYDIQGEKIAYKVDQVESSDIIEEAPSSTPIRIYTIGFTKKSAESFFTSLRQAGIKRLIDIRLNNVSQLAGFTKKDDLRFFLRELCHVEYLHRVDLAPTQEILDSYKKHKGDWSVYEQQFNDLISSRKIEETLSRKLLDGACLLCSEDEPQHCHRRLVVEYLQRKWSNVEIVHL